MKKNVAKQPGAYKKTDFFLFVDAYLYMMNKQKEIESEDHKARPPLPLYVYWDCDREKLDMERDKVFIICRMFECGKREDVESILEYYSKEVALKVLQNKIYFSAQGLNRARSIFKAPLKTYKSYALHRNRRSRTF